MTQLFQQARQIRERMSHLQEELQRLHVEGEAGGGLVRVEVNGLQQVLDVKLDASLMAAGEKETLEELLRAALNQAIDKSKVQAQQQLTTLAGGLNVPGMGELLRQFGGTG